MDASHPEMQGRHASFKDHINESLGLIDGIMQRHRRPQEPSGAPDTLSSEPGHRIHGSVLASLLQLQDHKELVHRSSDALKHLKHKPKLKDRNNNKKEMMHRSESAPNLQATKWLSSVTSSSHVVPSLKERQRTPSRRSRRLSIVSNESQFEPITTEDRVRIAFEIANILQRQALLCRLARDLMLYGCPAHRLEYILRQVSDTLKINAEFVSIPNIILINFTDPSTHTTETHFVQQEFGYDMNKLMEVYRLEKLVSHGEVTVDEAIEFLDIVSNDPIVYPVWANPFIYAAISVCGCVMFYGGRWKEAGLAACLAMFFAAYELFSEKFWGFRPIWEVTVCIIIGFVCRASTRFDFCFVPTAFASFIVILPGYMIVIAAIELVSRQLVSGVVRMVYAIIYSYLLGYGISMGSSLYSTIDRNIPDEGSSFCQRTVNANTCSMSVSQFYHFLTVPAFAIGYCLMLRARPIRWPIVVFVSVFGFAVHWLLSCMAAAPHQVIEVAPAFAVGLAGNLVTKITHTMSFDATLVAVFYLVPGSLGLKAALGLFGGVDEYSSHQGSFTLGMVETSIGITIGLCIANLVVYPKGAQHTPLMNF
ncbi:hypothetical protein BX666DRAFT_1216852 [Dichotomocladium elegans]|nr:hypothetical protein BX666DRAFT_1216852 [Dichotomocladium elegans]